jgi:hypothetical protein
MRHENPIKTVGAAHVTARPVQIQTLGKYAGQGENARRAKTVIRRRRSALHKEKVFCLRWKSLTQPAAPWRRSAALPCTTVCGSTIFLTHHNQKGDHS